MTVTDDPARVEKNTHATQASVEELLAALLAMEDPQAQRGALEQNAARVDVDALAVKMKEQADQLLRSDIMRSLNVCALLQSLSELTGSPHHRALGLLAEANARNLGLGEYEQAIQLYDQAAALYRENGRRVEQASAQAGKIGALTFLGRYEEALQTGQWAAEVLEQAEQWLPLARVVSNLAIVHYRLGDDARALAAFERAQRLYRQAGQAGSPGWLRAEFNRAIVLRNLGQFEASIESSQVAYEKLQALEQPVEAARARQNLALTYFVLGRYNEALENLDQVREVFLGDKRQRDGILTELFISDCLLQLRRFPEVLDKCQEVRQVFNQLGTQFEVGLAVLNEAVAYAGLKQMEKALASLHEARQLFDEQGNRAWVDTVDLEIAAVNLRQGQLEACCQAAQDCITRFESQPVKRAQAGLIAARALRALGRMGEAKALTEKALAIGKKDNVPALTFAAHALLGKLAEGLGDISSALEAYDHAIKDLEILRGRMMVEFRADFLEDKQSLYEDVVALYLQLDSPAEALRYAERAKSRALLEMIAYRLNLGLSALEEQDRQLAEELVRLRAERDRLYRRWESNVVKEEMRLRGGDIFEQDVHQAQGEVLAIERQITEIWHKLLIRNAAYARDASLWQVVVEPVQPYLDDDTLLLEYFFARDRLCLFLISQAGVQARYLEATSGQVQRLMQLMWLNWKAVQTQPRGNIQGLAGNAAGILAQLYRLLLAPVRDRLAAFPKLIIVPHGPLHYLPFHALYDGQEYLIASHEVSYLPASSFLRYSRETKRSEGRILAAGNSYRGQLSFTNQEAEIIARLWGEEPLIEDAVTLARIQEEAPECKALHLATHGSFRADSPLFSGLALADGWLTTLDIFNLRLKASLVTLSACETGRSVVGGGDELLGLMRAFLYAGTSSLVLSQWAVDDHSTARFMEMFYRHLTEGRTKGEALHAAQLAFLPGGDPQLVARYSHPYYWAPFFLVGDNGIF